MPQGTAFGMGAPSRASDNPNFHTPGTYERSSRDGVLSALSETVGAGAEMPVRERTQGAS